MIEVRNLSKSYGDVRAVRDVSFDVGRDQVVGFLGPNGAGKTTIMKILTCFHFPTEGTAVVDGVSVADDPVRVKERIGYLPENVPLYGDLSVDEHLAFAAEARLIPKRERRRAVDAALEACGLTGFRGRRVETLSKGYRQRAGLALAILHDPPILILDEPTGGLDPNQIIEIRELIRELGRRKTVILSSHILREVEAICSRVLIVNRGTIAAQGTPAEIAASMRGGDTWEILVKSAGSAGAGAGLIAERLSGLGDGIGSIRSRDLGDGVVELGFFVPVGEEDSPHSGGERIFDWAVGEGLKVLGMSRSRLSLEDIFVSLTAATETSAAATEGGRV